MVGPAVQGGHVGERQLDRGGVLCRVPQAQLTARVVAPAPCLPGGVHGKGGVVRHHVDRQERDLHAGGELYLHRGGERVLQVAVAEFPVRAQAPGIDGAVGQQRVLGGVGAADLGDRRGQAHRDRRQLAVVLIAVGAVGTPVLDRPPGRGLGRTAGQDHTRPRRTHRAPISSSFPGTVSNGAFTEYHISDRKRQKWDRKGPMQCVIGTSDRRQAAAGQSDHHDSQRQIAVTVPISSRSVSARWP